MKRLVVAFTSLAAIGVSAATYFTNNVEGLIYLLGKYDNTANTIELAPGDYPMPSEAMNTNQTIGYSSLYVGKNLTLRGTGSAPGETRLIGNGERVVYGHNNSTIENLMITNGYANGNMKTADKYKSSDRGGGYYGGGRVVNCIITGNKSKHVGGGTAGNTVLVGCMVEGNESETSGGGGSHSPYATNTVFRYNKAKTNGGAVMGGTLAGCTAVSNTAVTAFGGGGYNLAYATNTVFMYNTALYGGGIANGSSQNAAEYYIVDCAISNNTAVGPGGNTVGTGGGLYRQTADRCAIGGNYAVFGGGAIDSILTNCVVGGNTAWYSHGGGAYNCSSIGCTFVGNYAKGNGGGLYDATGTSVISNCVFTGNFISNDVAHAYGAGLDINNGTAYNCRMFGNAALECWGVDSKTGSPKRYIGTGGGAASDADTGVLVGCTVYDNYASDYGGGIRNLRAVDCVISNNVDNNRGANAHTCSLIGCDVSGTPVAYGSALGTVFHDIGSVVFTNNAFMAATNNYVHVYGYYPNCTNCLFRDNVIPGSSGNLFAGVKDNPSTSSTLVNCTIVSNCCTYMFCYFASNTCPMTVQNCVFFGNLNRNGTAQRGLASLSCTTNALRFSCCAYGNSVLEGDTSDWFDAGEYKFGEGGMPSSPGFMMSRDTAHPYSLRTTSPLRGLGQVMDWMTGACDFRGDADGGIYQRLRDGKVDLGCYQCWLDPVGITITIR